MTDEAKKVEALVADLGRMRGGTCSHCPSGVCAHQALMSLVMGFKSTPLCTRCLAQALEREPAELREQLYEYIQHRPCYREGWAWADRHCRGEEDMKFDDTWDAGDMGCGDLVLELRLRIQAMKPAQILRVVARDPGAPEDMPAWCKLTGHVLVEANHPVYLIRRKE